MMKISHSAPIELPFLRYFRPDFFEHFKLPIRQTTPILQLSTHRVDKLSLPVGKPGFACFTVFYQLHRLIVHRVRVAGLQVDLNRQRHGDRRAFFRLQPRYLGRVLDEIGLDTGWGEIGVDQLP